MSPRFSPDSYNLENIDWQQAGHLKGWSSPGEKIQSEHGVTPEEVEEALSGRFYPVVEDRTEKGRDVEGYVYEYYGRTEDRFLFVVVLVTSTGRGLLLTAREMTDREKRYYRNKV